MNYQSLLFSVVFMSTVCGLQAAKKPTISTHSLSLRTMSTGETLSAGNTTHDKHWNMVEVSLPSYLSNKFPFGAVQFHHVAKKDICLMNNGFFLTLGKCSAVEQEDYRTLFSLLPTTSGALQIRSIAQEGCIVVEPSVRGKKIIQNLKLLPCFNDTRQSIDLRWLWILTPALVDSKPAL